MDILVYVGVVIALTQIVKSAFIVPSRFIPFVALIIGFVFFAIAYVTGAATLDYKSIMDAVVGILSAMGLFSTVKAGVAVASR